MQVSESVPPELTTAEADTTKAEAPDATLEVVVLCALVAAVGAAFSGAAPTGTTWWDPLLTAGLAAAFVAAASRANTVTLVAVAGISAALVGLNPWLGFGLAGFATALAAEFRPAHRVELRALAGALTITALLHLKPIAFFGFSAVISGACVLAVVASWYRRAGSPAKRSARRFAGGVALLAAAVLAVGGVVGLSVRPTANQGVEAARNGLSSARAGDPQELTTQLEIAADRLSETSSKIDSVLLKPLYLLPVASQHLRALSVASGQGSLVANEAAAAVTEADLGELQLRQGAFDLDLLTTMAPRLVSVASQLETSVTRISDTQTWLVPPVDTRIQSLVDEVRDVLPEAQIAAEAAQVVPQMLGAQGERRYLMLFGSPGESREFGGFVGGYALLGVDDGRLDLVDAGSTNELRLLPRPDALPDPASYPTEFVKANPAFFPQNLTSTPNLAVILRAVGDIFPDLLGKPIDGVIYADPYALGAFTELTGPIVVPGLEEPLMGPQVADFIFDGQYRIFANRSDRDLRFETIGALAVATAAAFENADLPGPERLGEVLGPVARAGRLQVITNDDRENAFLASVLLQRNFIAPTSIDSVAVIQTNGTESKLDLYLHRDIHYDVAVDDSGSLVATVDVRLKSQIPDDAAPLTLFDTGGTNKVLLSLYSPHELVALTVGGVPHEYVTQEEFGFFRYALFNIALPANTGTTVRFELVGTAPSGPYRLGAWAQPLVNLDRMRVTYRAAGGDPILEHRELHENWVFDPNLSGD